LAQRLDGGLIRREERLKRELGEGQVHGVPNTVVVLMSDSVPAGVTMESPNSQDFCGARHSALLPAGVSSLRRTMLSGPEGGELP
jgi:hypothetical protein